MRTVRFGILGIWVLAAALTPAFAQVETARITGTVTDASGAVIPGVQITMVHLQTNRKVAATTNEAGHYVSIPLPLGNYRVEAETPGFKHVVRSGITLQVQQTAVVDVKMQVGEISERIEVVAEAPLLNTVEATQGQVIENKRIVDLPLNGRDYIQLALLSSGTAQGIGGRIGGFSAGGQRASQNNYLLDGVDNNQMQSSAQSVRGEAVKPSTDAIQEFKVVSNSYSAEYGRAGGGVVNVVLKSGTNNLHGTVFGFLRNEVFDAKNFFARSDLPKPPFKRSQFGGVLGGPIMRDKTFFFADYEGTRIRESKTVVNTIPTLAMRSGDFSGLGLTIYDPSTYDPVTRTRQPFANNRIPDNRIDAVARKAAAWYPTPQNSNRTSNFVFTSPSRQNVDKFDLRADHVFSSRDNIYYRFSFQRNFIPPSPSLPPPAWGGASVTADNGRNMALVWNHIFSPRLITATRLAWNSLMNDVRAPAQGNYNRELGLNGVDQTLVGGALFGISGYTQLGIGGFPNKAGSQTRQLVNDTTWMRGSHVVKFGINFMWLQSYNSTAGRLVGQFDFSGAFTRDPITLRNGDPFADFLLGITSSARVSTPLYRNLRAPWYNFYVSDEWKAAPRLTLTLGLRYELRRPLIETRDLNSNFDVDTNPGAPRLVLATRGSRSDRAMVGLSDKNFAPRFGFAYQWRTHTVVRGGYGLFCGVGENPYSAASVDPPFSIDGQLTTDNIRPNVVLRDGVPPGALSPMNMTTVRLQSLEWRPRTPITQQWNFNIQQEFGGGWLVEMGYFGTKSQFLQKEWDINYALPGPGSVDSRRRWRTLLWPGTNQTLVLSTVQRNDFNGNSLFHSFQTKVERRFTAGFSLLGSYMWSKTIGDASALSAAGRAAGSGGGPQNPLNFRPERSLEDNHLSHRFVLSPMWDLPFGAGRRLGSNWKGLANAVFGGWSVASIITLTTGRPMNVSVRGDPANTGATNRPDLVGNPYLDRSERTVARYFNTSAFAPNKQYTYGNTGRNILIGPGMENVDFAAYKQFRITEKKRLQFRFEAFDLFNTPHFAAPNLTVGDPNIGRITSADTPRNIQLGLKFVF